jgi:hypothetical protein
VGADVRAEVNEEQRRCFLNLPLQSYLLEPILDFVQRPQFHQNLPPLLQCEPQNEPVSHRCFWSALGERLNF